jgi:proto-oncogene tyrosine-protein kinase ROS
MFWVMEGTRGKGGLYRMDLAEVSNGVRHETRPELILDQLHLGAFTVDHANFRLLVADQGNNTVIAVSLDG